MKKTSKALLTVFFLLPFQAFAGVILIGLSDFDNANVIDFESAGLGAISGTDSLFTSAGISSIVATPQGADTDPYDSRTNSSRALGGNSTGLFIADPGTAGAADTNDWEINFTSTIFRFGFGVHDSNTNGLATLLFDGLEVGSINLTPTSSDLNQFYIESDVAFDRISLSQTSTLSGFGFMLDNLTLEAIDVPEPSIFALLTLGLSGLAMRRRRRTS